MSERNAFIVFGIGMVALTVGCVAGLNFLGADNETLAGVATLFLPIAGLGGGFLFMRYH